MASFDLNASPPVSRGSAESAERAKFKNCIGFRRGLRVAA